MKINYFRKLYTKLLICLGVPVNTGSSNNHNYSGLSPKPVNKHNKTSENDATSLERFIKGQNNGYGSYESALREVRKGYKVSHWIWYVFPQLRGLGHSRRSLYYGIADRKEAEAYLAHPILGARLREITTALLEHEGKHPESIFGSIDTLKVKSCMTLFDSISPDDIFAEVLDTFYNGERDKNSLI